MKNEERISYETYKILIEVLVRAEVLDEMRGEENIDPIWQEKYAQASKLLQKMFVG
jgi:hypothetical protein